MRRRKLAISTVLLLLTALALSACASFETTAYKAINATETLVDTAMKEYGVQYRAHQTTPEFDAKVKSAYQGYQAAALAAVHAVKGYAALKDQKAVDLAVADFQQAAVGLLNLFQPQRTPK